ncbi:MAG: hypothetical protein ABIK82_02205 [Pseudomonadota bacterium]
MKPVYVMSIAYDSLKVAERDVREINKEITSASGGDFKLAMKTQQSMLILFSSDVPMDQLSERLKGLAFRGIRYVLFPTDRILSGFLDTHVLDWLHLRLPRPVPKKP